MTHQKFKTCIEACNACVVACNHCAASCLREPDVKMMARCIALDMDCSEICALASAAMARGSEHASAICRLCADVCQSWETSALGMTWCIASNAPRPAWPAPKRAAK